MTATKMRLLAGGFAFTALLSSSAFAQPTAANARAAQLLFDEAKRLADQKDFAAACPKFVQSHQLDPAGGTILHAADCHEHQGKLATAWAEYNESLSFAVKANRADREAVSRARIDALAPKLAKLHVKLPAQAKKLECYSIWLDGTRLGDASSVNGIPIPVDAGSHTIEARATGYLTASQTFVILDGHEQNETFEDLAKDPAAEVAVQGPDKPVEDANRGRTQRIAGLVVAGVGVAGLAVGTIFGIRALAIGDQADKCTLGPGGNGCPQTAVDDQSKARTSGTVSTNGFIAGGVLAAGGLVLYFTAPKAGAKRGSLGSPRLGTSGLSLALSGEF